MGHTKVRCKNPLVSEDGAGDSGFGGFGGNDGGGDTATTGDDGGSGWPAAQESTTIDANSAW